MKKSNYAHPELDVCYVDCSDVLTAVSGYESDWEDQDNDAKDVF